MTSPCHHLLDLSIAAYPEHLNILSVLNLQQHRSDLLLSRLLACTSMPL